MSADLTVPPSPLSTLVHQVENAVLADPTTMDAEAAASLIDAMGVMRAKLKALNEQCEEVLKAYIKEHGDIEVGVVRYYVGTETFTTCKGHAATLKAVVQHCDGDFDGIAGFLASSAWKHGAIKKQLGEDKFDELFVTTPKEDLKTGKPLRKLKKSDPRFSTAKDTEHETD